MTWDRRDALKLLGTAPLGSMASQVLPARPVPMRPVAAEVEWRVEPIGIDTLRPRFGWRLAPNDPHARGIVQTRCQVVVSALRDRVRAGQGDIWDSGAMATATQRARPAADLALRTHGRYWWAVRVADQDGWSDWSEPASFTTGVLRPDDWSGAWIAAGPDPHLSSHYPGQARAEELEGRPLPLLRHLFTLAQPPGRAIVSLCGLGQYRLLVNDRIVSGEGLAPGWTNYRRTVLYDTFDITELLQAGANVIGLMLGNGMYNVEHHPGRYTKFLDSFGAPKARLLLSIEQRDGGMLQEASGSAWRWRDSPIRFSSIYGGEDRDARLDPLGWSAPGFDATGWAPVIVAKPPGGALRASSMPPVRPDRSLLPISLRDVAPGVTLVDFGENIAGRPALVCNAPAGTTVTLVPAELLDPQGRADQASFNAAPDRAVLFTYVSRGGGPERFEPVFTYHGFRYLEIRGLPRAAIVSIVAQTLHADLPRIGSFDARPALLGRIHRLIDHAVTSNLASVLTDCPQREKLGWLEQTYLNAPTVFYNRDAIPLYEKLVRDIAEAQQPDGMVPGIAPEYVAFVDGEGRDQIWRNSPEWGVAAILAPWAAFRFTGDATVLAAAYPAADRYCAYLAARARDGIVDFGMGDWYDLGPKDPGEAQLTSRALTGTAVLIEAQQAMAAIATLLGRQAAAADYRRRAARTTAAFNARFLDGSSGRYDRGSQTAQAMPLALGIVPPAARAAAAANLLAAVRANGNGVTAGDIGFRYLLAALTAVGRDDVVLDMLNVQDRPSYAMQLAKGATTLTEAWDANPTKSQNHFMLGQAEGWLYGRLGGLDIDHARRIPIRIAPWTSAAVGAASACLQVRQGRLDCSWSVSAGGLSMRVAIPAGATATIVVPTSHPDSLREGGRPVHRAFGLSQVATDADTVTLVAGSGRYAFTSSL